MQELRHPSRPIEIFCQELWPNPSRGNFAHASHGDFIGNGCGIGAGSVPLSFTTGQIGIDGITTFKDFLYDESDADAMNRILVLGPPGSGKTTIAKRLGVRLEYPVIHLDAHFWKPGWEMPSKQDWIETQRELMRSSETWIMDGNYDGTLEVRLPEADTVVLLELSRWRSISRVINRWLSHRGEVRDDMADGCPEKIDLEFLWYAWSFTTEELPLIEQKIERFGGDVTVHTLDTSTQNTTEAFLDRFGNSRGDLGNHSS